MTGPELEEHAAGYCDRCGVVHYVPARIPRIKPAAGPDPVMVGQPPDVDNQRASSGLRPQPKVVAATAAGAATVVLVWVVGLLGLDVPPEVASAVTVLLAAGAGYLKRA